MKALVGYLLSKKSIIDEALDRHLPQPTEEPCLVHQCMRYSIHDGKRIRPIITLAIAEALGCCAERALPTCTAIELIHAHSLILDDLPCMDDDDFRRGRLTSHRVFGEGIALLTADALLNLAITLLATNHLAAGLRPETALEIIREVGETVGPNGMIGGQAADLAFSQGADGSSDLEKIHVGKTAKLFRLSARVAALAADASPDQLSAVASYGEHLGLAFQIIDDVLDGSQSEAEGGKKTREQPNYALAYGVGGARCLARRITDQALLALTDFGHEAEMLRLLARHNLERAF